MELWCSFWEYSNLNLNMTDCTWWWHGNAVFAETGWIWLQVSKLLFFYWSVDVSDMYCMTKLTFIMSTNQCTFCLPDLVLIIQLHQFDLNNCKHLKATKGNIFLVDKVMRRRLLIIELEYSWILATYFSRVDHGTCDCNQGNFCKYWYSS